MTDFEPQAITADAVQIRLVYKEYPYSSDDVIRVGATISQVVANLVFLINQTTDERATELSDMKVKYTFPADYEVVKYAGKTFEKGVEASRFTADRTISVTRQYPSSVLDGQGINDLARSYVGKTNASDWEMTPGDALRSWLCAGIEGISNDNGLSYVVAYSFQHRGDGWDKTVIYIDPNDGRPPPDIEFGVGNTISSKNKYAVQESVDFNAIIV